MKDETLTAMRAVEDLLKDGSTHTTTSIGGAIKSPSRSVTSNLVNKLQALGVIETFEVIHKQQVSGGMEKRIRLRCAKATSRSIDQAIGQQSLDLGGDVCLPEEQEAILSLLRSNVLERFPKTRAVQDSVWSKTKLEWLKAVTAMVRLDKVDLEEQAEVLSWLVASKSRDGRFWAGQVRSGSGWRRHFPTIHGVYLREHGAAPKGIDQVWDDWREKPCSE